MVQCSLGMPQGDIKVTARLNGLYLPWNSAWGADEHVSRSLIKERCEARADVINPQI